MGGCVFCEGRDSMCAWEEGHVKKVVLVCVCQGRGQVSGQVWLGGVRVSGGCQMSGWSSCVWGV